MELRHGLLAEGPADVEAVAIELRDVGGRPTEQREQRNRFAVLLHGDRQRCEARARRLSGDLERALLADELLGFVDREARRFAAAGDEIRGAGGEKHEQNERGEPSQHRPNHTSLLT